MRNEATLKAPRPWPRLVEARPLAAMGALALALLATPAGAAGLVRARLESLLRTLDRLHGTLAEA